MKVETDGKVGAMRAHQHQHQPIIFQPRSPDGVARVSEDGQVPTLDRMGGGQREPCVAYPIELGNKGSGGNLGYGDKDDPVFTLQKSHSHAVALPLGTRVDRGGSHREGEGNNIIIEQNNKSSTPEMINLRSLETPNTAILASPRVRRLTPRECERLQGFPDDYTLIPYGKKPAADGPRYKALGNSMAVPVVRWIGERLKKVMELP